MRQGQQNRRGRGRNRKGQNPLTRSYESNGPDVKIRGTPAHVAEKYMSLARDAMASGDRVLAENYFQHAEHYNRIIMAFRDQQIGGAPDGVNGRPRHGGGMDDGDGADDFGDDDGDLTGEYTNGHGVSDHQPMARGMEEQPPVGGGGGSSGGQDRERRNGARQRRGRNRNTNSGERGQRGGGEQGSARAESSEGDAGGRQSRGPDRERFAESEGHPEFLRRPVRRPQASEAVSAGDIAHDTSVISED